MKPLIQLLCVWILCGAVALASTGDPSAGGADAASEVPRVTNVFYNTSLRDALADISAQTGEIIVSDETVQGIVTCDLTDVPLDEALRIVLSVGNFTFARLDGFILVGSANPDSPTFSKLSRTERIAIDHLEAKTAVSLLSTDLQKYARGVEGSNLVNITAPPEILERVKADLLSLDRAPRQVLLDSRIVVMENGDLFQMGLEWDFPQVQAGAFTNDLQYPPDNGLPAIPTRWPWGVQVGYTPSREFTNSMLVTLNLLAQNDEATVVASPQVLTEDQKQAQFSVTTEEYFEILTQGYYDTSELEKIEAGTVLDILPSIKQDGRIAMTMRAEVSDVVSRGANNFPVVTRRVAESTVHVEDGGTAVVAGLLDNRSRSLHERVPILGHIPLIGLLFRSESSTSSRRQVAVFVTARVVPENGQALEAPSEPKLYEPVNAKVFRYDLERSLREARRQ